MNRISRVSLSKNVCLYVTRLSHFQNLFDFYSDVPAVKLELYYICSFSYRLDAFLSSSGRRALEEYLLYLYGNRVLIVVTN